MRNVRWWWGVLPRARLLEQVMKAQQHVNQLEGYIERLEKGNDAVQSRLGNCEDANRILHETIGKLERKLWGTELDLKYARAGLERSQSSAVQLSEQIIAADAKTARIVNARMRKTVARKVAREQAVKKALEAKAKAKVKASAKPKRTRAAR